MTLKRNLQLWFGLVFVILLAGTIYASLEKNVLQAYVDLGRDRWGLATLFDAYFGFIAFFLWVAYKEVTVAKRVLWFVLLMSLGNFAISGYALWQLSKWDPKTGAAGLLLRSAAPAKATTAKRRKK
jgi:amino acid permease